MCYFEHFQSNAPISSIDPVLKEIISYRHPAQPANPTFGEKFSFNAQDLFTAFHQALQSLGATAPQFWLNIEAFEYIRSDPCKPLDRMGNGMGEILNRSNKKRIDWAIQSQSAFVSGIISFAWDSDYLCTTNEYKQSISTEIQEDWDRPIIN